MKEVTAMNENETRPAKRKAWGPKPALSLLAVSIVLTLAVIVIVAVSTPAPAQAVSSYLTSFRSRYPSAVGTKLDSCSLCHPGGNTASLNAFASDFASHNHDYAAIESLDSDGDGYNNLAEIVALTWPGDANDHPAGSLTPTHTPVAPTPSNTPVVPTPTNTPAPPPTAPVDPNASAEAKNLFKYLYSIQGNHILAGQQGTAEIGRVFSLTGKYPALKGDEVSNLDMNSAAYHADLSRRADEAIAWWNNGGVVTLMWHASYPGASAKTWWNVCCGPWDGTLDWNAATTPGTPAYNALITDLDEVANYGLKKLRDAHVPILWRPYHQMDGVWFWWGARPNYAALWKIMYDRFVNYHGLHNLLWVWSPNDVTNAAAYFPGSQYVDIVTLDRYAGSYSAADYNALVRLSNGKASAIGETAALPAPNVLASQNRWAWFLEWSGTMLESNNTPDQIRATYNDPHVITRDEVPNLKASPTPKNGD
jgi:mannan endo-1,4-beta-mannosidase